MQNDITAHVSEVAEAFGGKKASSIFGLIIALKNAIMGKKKLYQKRKKILTDQKDDPSHQYISVVLDNFIGRRFKEYVYGKEKSLKHIKKEIEQIELSRTVIITGYAGIGKSTVLKWLFVNGNCQKGKYDDSIYISSRMVTSCKSLEDFENYLEPRLSGRNHCLVFFDGMDELSFLKGQKAEFKQLLKLFEDKSNSTEEKHKFVITTRPEHFDFHKNIREKEVSMASNIVVYTMLPLNKKESLKICKLIKKLQQHELKQSIGNWSFKDKYPSTYNEKTSLTEHKYIHLLKKYIANIDIDKSLLTYPLLCRYAYIIICNRYFSQDKVDNHEVMTQSTRIEKVLDAYIKWEFHDENRISASSAEGQPVFEKYKRQTYEFLANVANIMDERHVIDKDKWSEIKQNSKLRLNAALCMLQEDNFGNLTFVHSSFWEYFLARYFVEVVPIFQNEHEISRFRNLVEHNSSFLTMYTELLLATDNIQTKDVCMVLNKVSKSVDEASEFICGKSTLIYHSNYCFTIARYFDIIPMGIVEYAGCTFNLDNLKKILTSGILELNDTKYLTTCNVNALSEGNQITAVVLKPKFDNEIKVVTSNFKCVFNDDVHDIGGYWSAPPLSEDDIKYLFNRTEFGRIFENMPIESLLKDENIISAIRLYKKSQDIEKQSNDNYKIHDWIDKIIAFLGRNKNFWCIYDDYRLYVYQMIKENEQHISTLFQQGLVEKRIDYLALWGEYLTHSVDEKTLIDYLTFKSSNAIRIAFSADNFVFDNEVSCIRNYYLAHWKNYQLLHYKQSQTETISKLLLCYEIIDLYEETEKSLSEKPNSKIRLITSDEEVITYFLIGIGDEMARIAEETLELCDRYNHTAGRELREFLIKAKTEYGESEYDKVCNYLEKNIWL